MQCLNVGRRRRDRRFDVGGGFVVVVEQDWREVLFHVPADVVGQHAQEHVLLHCIEHRGAISRFGRAARTRKRLRGNAVRSRRGGQAVLGISRLSRWSIGYYNDTANKAMAASMDRRRANGRSWGSTTPRATPAPTWLLTGNTDKVAEFVGWAVAPRRAGSRTPRPRRPRSTRASPRTAPRGGGSSKGSRAEI